MTIFKSKIGKVIIVRQKGKITNWNDDKGFGFITPNGGGKDIFIHIKAFNKQIHRPEINQNVTYTLCKDRSGQVFAKNVLRAGEKKAQPSKNKNSAASIFVLLVFSVYLAYLILTKKISVFILVFYAAVSFMTIIMYAIDKSAARKGKWRTPETTLHILSLVGGWPGAMIAQQMLRHKSIKQPFRMIFWLTVFVNIGVFIWLLTPGGNKVLQLIFNILF